MKKALGGYEVEMLISNKSECSENLCIKSLNLHCKSKAVSNKCKAKMSTALTELHDGVNEAQ